MSVTDFDTIQQADVEAASKLRDIAFATTDQTTQRQKLFLEDEIKYEKIKTAAFIEQTQRTLDHENDLRKIENARIKAKKYTNMDKCKADIAAELNLRATNQHSNFTPTCTSYNQKIT